MKQLKIEMSPLPNGDFVVKRDNEETWHGFVLKKFTSLELAESFMEGFISGYNQAKLEFGTLEDA